MEEQLQQVPASPGAPRVSVLIVLRPGSPSIEQLLVALEQGPERESLDIAVLDNGSRAVTGTLEDQFPRVTFRRLPRNFGFTKAVNILARNATGEFLLFLDPGLEVRPETVGCLLQALSEHADVGAVSPWITLPQASVGATGLHALPDAAGLAAAWREGGVLPGLETAGSEPYPVEFISVPAVLVRREFVRGMNFFDERYGEFGPMLELCFQLRQAGRKLVAVPSCPAVWRNSREQEAMSEAARAQIAADFALGASRYLTKRSGWGAGLGFRARAVLAALGRTLAFRSPGYNARQFWYIASGQKIDGTQTAL